MCKGRCWEGKSHGRKAVLGGYGGMLPRENFETLVQFGGIWCIFLVFFESR